MCSLVSVWTKVSTAKDAERRVESEYSCTQGRQFRKGQGVRTHGPGQGVRKALGGEGGHSDLIVLLSAQTKGQLELDVILRAAGRGLAEKKYEGRAGEARARVTGREAGQKGPEGQS